MKKQIYLRQMGFLLFMIITLAWTALAQNYSFLNYKAGRYEGEALNTTYNSKGTVVFEIRSIDQAGNVSAYFVASNGLVGEGGLTGKIDSEGILRLSGNISGWKMSVAARISNNIINANYRLSDSSSTQDGNFSVLLKSQFNNGNFGSSGTTSPPSNSNNGGPAHQTIQGNSAADINGAWKGTYTCAQGLTNLILSLYSKDGANVKGIFTFLLGDGASMSVLGSFRMNGTYDSRSGRLEMNGAEWDEKPSEYQLVNLSGNVNAGRSISGRVSGAPNCTTFQIEKISFK